MRDFCRLTASLLAFALLAAPAHAQQSGKSAVPVYKPPLRGAPVARVGGGTRGADDDVPTVIVLDPEHTGLTASPRPTLYWFSSGPANTRVEISMIDDTAIEPLLETGLDAVGTAGYHAVSLAEHGVSLEPGVSYQWSVTLVVDPSSPSTDIVSGGAVVLEEPSPALASKLAAATERERPFLYAENGYWYDAVAALSELIDRNPGDRTLLEQRAALLEQAGLDAAAVFDRSKAE